MKNKYKLDFNAPVILCITIIAFIVLILTMLSGNSIIYFLGVRFSSWADPMMYVRLFTHIFVHSDLSHYTGNFMMILAIGPMVEEKYGSKNIALMIAITAFFTGLINVVFFKNSIFLGASGVVFMLIILASFANLREKRIPITVILVAFLYLGNEILTGVLSQDNISQLSHILGGVCGGVFGLIMNKGKTHSNRI